MRKIALAGPSGSGKTTAAQIIQEKFDVPFISTSAGSILTFEDQKELEAIDNYTASGHASVISLSHKNPEFGLKFQQRVRERRAEIINKKKNFIIDRSPIDNVVYFALQALPYQTEEVFQEFVKKSVESYKKLTHVILMRSIPEEVEDNNSRVANSDYQKMVNQLFKYYYETYFKGLCSNVLVLSEWDLEKKQKMIEVFLNN